MTRTLQELMVSPKSQLAARALIQKDHQAQALLMLHLVIFKIVIVRRAKSHWTAEPSNILIIAEHMGALDRNDSYAVDEGPSSN